MKVHIKEARITFPVLFEAKQVNGQGEPKFNCGLLIPKAHPQKAEIERGIVEAAKAKWGDEPTLTTDENGAATKLPKYMVVLKQLKSSDKLALHDGDAKSDYDGYAGHFFINASNKIRPLVIGPDRAPLTAADGKPYSGCYVNAIIELWAQDNQFGKRVNASLLGVQFVKDGTRLAGGGVAAADDFEAIPQEAAQTAETSGTGAASLF